jgi:flagellar biosynthesis/type III secretory pathway protein FliH
VTTEPRLEIEREQAAALTGFVGTIAAAAERIATDRKRMVDEMTSEVADLAFAVVESVLGANLTGPDELRGALLKALELVPSNEAIIVRLHPNAPIDPSSLSDLVETTTITVVSDASVVPNGCVVEAGASRIDAQIPTAVDRARRVFETLRYDYQESSRS